MVAIRFRSLFPARMCFLGALVAGGSCSDALPTPALNSNLNHPRHPRNLVCNVESPWFFSSIRLAAAWLSSARAVVVVGRSKLAKQAI